MTRYELFIVCWRNLTFVWRGGPDKCTSLWGRMTEGTAFKIAAGKLFLSTTVNRYTLKPTDDLQNIETICYSNLTEFLGGLIYISSVLDQVICYASVNLVISRRGNCFSAVLCQVITSSHWCICESLDQFIALAAILYADVVMTSLSGLIFFVLIMSSLSHASINSTINIILFK